MSLRLRLTLLYTTLLGGVLLLFGTLVYGLISFTLLEQFDNILKQSTEQLISVLQVNSFNQFNPRLVANFKPAENLIFQVWDVNHGLQIARPASIQTPLDAVGLVNDDPMFNTTLINQMHLRVFSVPIQSSRGPVGVVQVAVNLALLDIIQRVLSVVLIILTVLAMVITGVASWLVNGRTLSRLETITLVATNITRADDLSRRIPVHGSEDDEVGKLIRAFNQTLERLEQLFTSQRRFIADVSHEFRTPLTVIKGNIGLIRRIGQIDEESLTSIEGEVDRLTRLVGDMLLLAQAESGRLPLDMKPTELDTLLLEVYQQMRMLAGERLQIRLVDIDQVQVNGDHDRLKQVLLNLVGNAMQYTPVGGQITLALRKSSERAQVIISDNGPGIPAQDLPHIFERFYRGEKSRTRSKGTGFGLGLSIAYWIINNHNGIIEVNSVEGKGTTFSVWLPLLKPNLPEA
jgi:two-component system, OmpR family, sensor kinase